MKPAITYLGLIISLFSYGQVEYFEFNNPNVTNISEETIDILTSSAWYGNFMLDYGRHDTVKTRIIGTRLIYFPDNTYTINNSDKERWTIEKNKYILHSVVDSMRLGVIPKFGGILGIIEINDSLLHLMKLQTSTHDMQRHIIFTNSSKISNISVTKEINGKDRVSGAYFIEDPTPQQLESISNSSVEELFFNDVVPVDDSILIQTKDTIFMIKWKKN